VASRVVLEEPEPVATREDRERRVHDGGDGKGERGRRDGPPRRLPDEERGQAESRKYLRASADRERRRPREAPLREPPLDPQHHRKDGEEVPVEARVQRQRGARREGPRPGPVDPPEEPQRPERAQREREIAEQEVPRPVRGAEARP